MKDTMKHQEKSAEGIKPRVQLSTMSSLQMLLLISSIVSISILLTTALWLISPDSSYPLIIFIVFITIALLISMTLIRYLNGSNKTRWERFPKSEIEESFGDNVFKQLTIKSIYYSTIGLKNRIDRELERLQKSANVNLLIGILASAVAIGTLFVVVFIKVPEYEDTSNFIFQFAPRISFVIFIELLSFFFLRIYKSLLEDIKYFNNEKTNIDLKILALETAFYRDDKDLIDKTISEYLRTERNFKLGKDESTVASERNRIDSDNSRMLVDLVAKLSEKIPGT
ncbi:MAG: hypothetical protein QNK23_13765 [Crocinitomicaceae bacterium]|nr:hypothetical protein [Crocinitomicaceae bacterium]